MNDTDLLNWIETHAARIDWSSGVTVGVIWWKDDELREAVGVDLRDAIRGACVGEHVRVSPP